MESGCAVKKVPKNWIMTICSALETTNTVQNMGFSKMPAKTFDLVVDAGAS